MDSGNEKKYVSNMSKTCILGCSQLSSLLCRGMFGLRTVSLFVNLPEIVFMEEFEYLEQCKTLTEIQRMT